MENIILIDAMLIRNEDNVNTYPEIGTIGMVEIKRDRDQVAVPFFYRDDQQKKHGRCVWWDEVAVLDAYGHWHSPEKKSKKRF